MAAGTGATEGFLFVDRYNGELLKLDAATGEVKYTLATGASTVSVDPSNSHIFSARNTGGSSTIDEYDASGATEATLVSSFKPGGTAEGVAANGASEEVYVSRSGTENVEVYGAAKVIPDVVTEAASSNTGVRATLAGTVNPDGVELDECFFEWGQGSGSTAYTDTAECVPGPGGIGTGTSPVAVHADLTGLTPQGTEYHYRLVAVNPNATISGSNQNFTTPDTVITEAATGVTPTAATLNGTVNPDTATISECVFEWGPEKPFYESTQNYPEAAPCVPGPGGIGSGTTPVAVEAVLDELHPGTRYAYRLRVDTGTGSIYADNELVQSSGPAILATWVGNVTYTEASLRTQISPEGSATTYRFEYGKTTAYGSETSELTVGSDSEAHELSRFLEDLEPGATYHYRVIANSGVAENVGPDRAFSTYQRFTANTDCTNQALRTGRSVALPNCRAYEMVSPVDKNGGNALAPFCCGTEGNAYFEQSSLNGEKLTYTSEAAFGDQISHGNADQYMATRRADGWVNHGLNAPLGTKVFGPPLPNPQYQLDSPFQAFTPDLSSAWMLNGNKVPLTGDAATGFGNLYRRDNGSDQFEALTTTTPSAYLGGGYGNGLGIEFRGFSDDLQHQVFDATAALTANAAASTTRQVYDMVAGQPHLVSVLPDGTAASAESWVGTPGGAVVSSTYDNSRSVNSATAISSDGRRIYWSTAAGFRFGVLPGTLYLRENPANAQSALDGEEQCLEPEKACTIPVSATAGPGKAIFWAADPSGSKAIFSLKAGKSNPAEDDLFEFDASTGTSSPLAGRVAGVLGASDDLSHIYFVSKEALAPGTVEGNFNLYMLRDGVVTFIGAVEQRDVDGGASASGPSIVAVSPFDHAARVTPDGQSVVFESSGRLTGYDNSDAVTGAPDLEVFIYRVGGGLSCVSCKPSGARPLGRKLRRPYFPRIATDRDAAAWIPTAGHSLSPVHMLSDDGTRVFFNAFDDLVPQDNNGQQDVYQWESPGTHGCLRNGGCLSLISTGESSSNATPQTENEFVDASIDGRDVFFRTLQSLDPRDPGSTDIYDARAGGGIPFPPDVPPCFGDSCQKVPQAPQAKSLSSSVFHGSGNANPVSTRSCARPARRAQKLSRRAKRLRSHSESAKRSGKSAIARKRSKKARRLAKRAMSKSKNAKRCRRARHNRRAQR